MLASKVVVETLSEQEEESFNTRPAGVLVYVLRYLDLLANDAMALPALGPETRRIEIRRAPEGTPLAFLSEQLLVPDQYISSQHASVRRQGIADVIQDLGSKHGTFVNGRRITDEEPLHDGDVIEIGHSLLCYRRVNERLAGRLVASDEKRFGPTRTLSAEVTQMVDDLDQIAATDQPVLILGETGTGKEVAALHIHQRSGRPGPFVAIDCGAIPEHLIESDLFGHRRGAFSGAMEERKGRIRSADGGSVFLDEIANMSTAAQARLLRVVQERKVVPVGADTGRDVDVRWISATNIDVFADDATLRADLRARLAGYVGVLPPLRRRREDLGILGAHLLSKADFPRVSIRKQAGRALFLGKLAGNIRELNQLLRRAATLADGAPIDIAHLGLGPNTSQRSIEPPDSADPSIPAPDRSLRPGREEIVAALKRAGGIQGEAARYLGIHEKQLARWMDSLEIPRARSRK